MVKLDFVNAFKILRRDFLLRKVSELTPDLHHLVHSAYGKPSCLFYGACEIQSSCGVQQCDPLGPALFCLGTKELVDSLTSPLNLWYLDDGTLAGDLDCALSDIRKVLLFEEPSGLRTVGKIAEIGGQNLFLRYFLNPLAVRGLRASNSVKFGE